MTTSTPLTGIDLATAAELAAQLRVDSIRSSTSAGSGHPTSSMSAADLLAVLVSRHLRYDWDQPHAPGNDHLIFSKGHASPLLYSVYKAVGVVSDEELMTGYRRFGSRLEGHPTPVLPWVDVATGSLGQGLPDGVGVALAGKYLDQLPYKVWVLCGDSELAEGSIWEAFDKASYYQLSNLIAMVDVNRLGQRGPTDLEWNLDAYARRAEAFGARVLTVDGHDLAEIDEAMATATDRTGSRPTVILARTIKGRGFSEVENKNGWHGKPFPPDMADRAIAELGGERDLVRPRPTAGPGRGVAPPATRRDAERRPGAAPDTAGRQGRHPQGLRRRPGRTRRRAARGGGAGRRGQQLHPRRRVRAGLPGALLRDVHRRAADGRRGRRAQRARLRAVRVDLRRVLHPRLRLHPDGRHLPGQYLRLVGSHAGVEIGADGPSQMALEDLAMMRAVHGSTVLYPERRAPAPRPWSGDGRPAGRQLPAHHPRCLPGPLRDRRELPHRRLQGAAVGDADTVTLIGAGVTLHECLAAADLLAADGISARVIDLYSVKPVDTETLLAAVAAPVAAWSWSRTTTPRAVSARR